MTFDVRQADDRVEGRSIARVGVASGVVFVVSLVVAAALLGVFSTRSAAVASAPPASGTVERTLLLGTPRGLEQRARARESLSRWEWVDRDAGVARIPVDRAIDIIAADGGAP
jgi:hypothetical protein